MLNLRAVSAGATSSVLCTTTVSTANTLWRFLTTRHTLTGSACCPYVTNGRHQKPSNRPETTRLRWCTPSTHSAQPVYKYTYHYYPSLPDSPVGFSPEAYRIYEAMSFGSIPVMQRDAKIVAGSMQSDNYVCRDTFHLFKDMHAPVVWLEDWKELAGVLQQRAAESDETALTRRLVTCV